MSILLWWQLLQWREYLEITLFMSIAWYMLRLLNKDTKRPFIAWACGYFVILCAAWYIQLTALVCIMLFSTPCLIAFCMIMHQHSLQRALIAQPTQISTEPWPEQVIKLSIHAFQRSVNIIWIIEQNYCLTGALHNGILMHAPLSLPLFDLILTQHPVHLPLIVWLTAEGKLKCINPTYSEAVHKDMQQSMLTEYAAWQRTALIINRSLHACTVYSDATTRLFTLVMHNKLYADISAPHALTMLKHSISLSHKDALWNESSSSVSDHSLRAYSGHASSEHRPGT